MENQYKSRLSQHKFATDIPIIENNILITSQDLEKSLKISKETLERILNHEPSKSEENYYGPDFYRELQEYIKQQLLKRKKVLYPDSLSSINPNIISGFDSPESRNEFKQQLSYRNRYKSRLESYLRNQPNTPPKPIPVSQETINRIAGVRGARVLGLYCPDTNEIYIVDNLTPSEEEEVYAHEVEHWRDPSAPEWVVRDRVRRMGYSHFH